MSYEATANDDVVRKIDSTDIDLTYYINEYLSIEQQWINRALPKTEADQETLDFWNEHIGKLGIGEEATIREDAQRLYEVLLPIYQAGLIPIRYNDELLRLKNFVEE